MDLAHPTTLLVPAGIAALVAWRLYSRTRLVRSPLTLFIFGTLAGYRVAYAIGLLRWRHRVDTDVAAPGAT
jgi:hypothetical protein